MTKQTKALVTGAGGFIGGHPSAGSGQAWSENSSGRDIGCVEWTSRSMNSLQRQWMNFCFYCFLHKYLNLFLSNCS